MEALLLDLDRRKTSPWAQAYYVTMAPKSETSSVRAPMLVLHDLLFV